MEVIYEKEYRKYTRYCTKEQTIRAAALGAKMEYCPLEKLTSELMVRIPHRRNEYLTPTVEQMIGWLEERFNLDVFIAKSVGGQHYRAYATLNGNKDVREINCMYVNEYGSYMWNFYDSKHKAYLALIDKILDYFEQEQTNNK